MCHILRDKNEVFQLCLIYFLVYDFCYQRNQEHNELACFLFQFSFDCFLYKSRDFIIFLVCHSSFYQLPQWRPMVLNQRHLYSRGDIWQSLEIFLVVTTWSGGMLLASRDYGAGDAAKQPTLHRTEPNNKEVPIPRCQQWRGRKTLLQGRFLSLSRLPPFPTHPVFFSQNLFPGFHCFSFCNLIKNLGWYFLISKCRKKKSHGSLLKVSASSPHLQIFWHVDLEWPKILHLKKAPR